MYREILDVILSSYIFLWIIIFTMTITINLNSKLNKWTIEIYYIWTNSILSAEFHT